jgi:hypothetical protein
MLIWVLEKSSTFFFFQRIGFLLIVGENSLPAGMATLAAGAR